MTPSLGSRASGTRPLDYFLLHNARPSGACVGRYADKEIPASVIDDFGRHYVFVGVASRKADGTLDADALQTGEFILQPGLVYRLKHIPPSWFETLFGPR